MQPYIILAILIVFGLIGIASITVLSLIPIFIASDRTPYPLSSKFTMNYNVSGASLSDGSLSSDRNSVLQNQLASSVDSSLMVNITSATVVNVTTSGRFFSEARATNSIQQMLKIIGIISASSNCTRTCFDAAQKKFKTKLCEIELSIGL